VTFSFSRILFHGVSFETVKITTNKYAEQPIAAMKDVSKHSLSCRNGNLSPVRN
jgi:hypothetical protein